MDSKTKKWMLLQIGLFIVFMVLFIGAISTITTTTYIERLNLINYVNTSTITIRYTNATSGTIAHSDITYNLSQIASVVGDEIVINIPAHPNYTQSFIYAMRIEIQNVLFGEIINLGINKIVFKYQATTFTDGCFAAVMGSVWPSSPTSGPCGFAMGGYTLLASNLSRINGVEHELTVDPLAIANAFNNFASQRVMFTIGASHWFAGASYMPAPNTIRLKIILYTASDRPILRGLLEPIYSFFAALYAAFMSVIRKVKQVLVSAFGGFVSSFTLTGLIGDPVIALILTIIFITIIFLVIKPHKRLKL